ncbi:XrtA/PEP-CTERM system TPR-repeat protein PrsT [Neptunicella sp. SCSIO 80796]|uniref:XrtA/PEP-CTERM system TPR-repeat protein PrsT n=1 Tax=Neptunicella plasticusilytica TaxID=3117012 RepID=UPI003A4E15AE
MKCRNSLLYVFIPFAAAILTACSQQTPEQLVSKAEKYMNAGNSEAAIIELKNALTDNPDLGKVRLMLGKVYFQHGDLNSAEKELNRATDLGIPEDMVAPLLIKTYYHSDQFSKVNEYIQKLQLNDKEALSTSALYSYISALRTDDQEIIQNLDKLLEQMNAQDKQLAMSFAAFGEQKFDEARSTIDELIQQNHRPEITEYLSALLFVKEDNFHDAALAFNKINELIPVINSINFQYIEAMINAGELDNAEVEATRLLEQYKNQPLLNLYQARIDYQKEKFKPALDHAEIAIQNGADTLTARMIAGVSAYKLENLEKAYHNLTNLSSRTNSSNDAIQRLLAQVQLNLGYNNKALESLNSMGNLTDSDAELFALTGMRLATLGDIKNAKELLKKADQLDQNNPVIKLRQAIVNIGNDERAVIENLEKVIKDDESLEQGWMQLAAAHLRVGDKNAALSVAKNWEEKDPANGKTLAGFIYMNTGEADKAIDLFNEALKIDPVHMGAHQYLLQTYSGLKQYQKALDKASEILSFAPDNTPALIALIDAGKSLDKSSEIDDIISKLIKDANDKKIALAVNAKAQGNASKAISILTGVDLDFLGYMTLGDSQVQAKDFNSAMATYKNWESAYPNALMPVVRQIGLLELQSDNEGALALTEAGLNKFPNRHTLLLLKLHYLTKLNQIKAANDLLAQIKKQDDKSGAELLPYYEGSLALNEKDFKKAEKLLSEHHKKSPNFTSATMLAKAMLGNNQIDEAEKVLIEQLNSTKNPPKSFMYGVANFYTFTKNYEKAGQIYAQSIDKYGENLQVLNNLAYNRIQSGDIEGAREPAQKALKLAPDMPQILDTMGWVEFKSGNLDQAYQYLSSAAKKAPNINDIVLHLAEVLIELKQYSKASLMMREMKDLSSIQRNTRTELSKKIP